MSTLLRLSRPAMTGLAEGIESGRVPMSFTPASLSHYLPDEVAKEVRGELLEMAASGMKSAHIARTLRLLAEERAVAQAISDRF